jgi:anti-sigma-K factor RskA
MDIQPNAYLKLFVMLVSVWLGDSAGSAVIAIFVMTIALMQKLTVRTNPLVAS